MALFGTVSEQLTGTCRTLDGAPTITLTDHANEFYTTVDVTVVLTPDKKSVTSVDGEFGEDSEGFTWKLAYQSSKPATGTSAIVKTSASTSTVSGKLTAKETRKGRTTTEVLPFKITVKCASSAW